MRGRFYEPVAVQNGYLSLSRKQSHDHYAVRGQDGHRHRLLGIELGLTRRAADLLCDLLEEVRDYALNEGAEE